MNQQLRSLFCVTLCLFLFACSDTATSPNDPGGDGSVDSSFAVTSLDADSLYRGERGTIRGRGFGHDPTVLKLFAGTSKLSITAVSDSTVDFIVADDASGGVFRLYRNDTLATGSVAIFIIPRRFDATSDIFAVAPRSGYEGETLSILGTNLIFRQRDTKLMFGTTRASMDSFSSTSLFTTIPVGVSDGPIQIETPWQTIPVGYFLKLKRPSPTIFGEGFQALVFTLRLRALQDILVLEDSVKSTGVMELNTAFHYTPTTPPMRLEQRGDSLTYFGVAATSGDTTTINLRFKIDSATCTLSGTLDFSRVQSGNQQFFYKQSVQLSVDKAIYRDYSNRIDLLTTQIEAPASMWLERFDISEWDSKLLRVAALREPIRLDDPNGFQIDPMIKIQFLKE